MAAVDDWGKVAAIVAIVTIPVFASPLLLQPLFAYARRYIRRLLSRWLCCDALPFEIVEDDQAPFLQPPAPFRWFPPTVSRTTSRFSLAATSSNNDTIISLFNRAWAVHPRQVDRPEYLPLGRRYLRMDADGLMAALMLLKFDAAPAWHNLAQDWPSAPFDAQGYERFGDRPYVLQHGTVKGHFYRRMVAETDGAYLVGKLHGFPPTAGMPANADGPTKGELLAIARGYPPFYRRIFQSYSGVDVVHPIGERRDRCRGGWVVAIGFSSHKPTRLYNARFSEDYKNACERVSLVLRNVLCTTFGGDPTVRPAVEAAAGGVELMNRAQTGSVLSRATRQTVFGDAATSEVGQDLNLAQIRRILDLFNDGSRSDPLSDVERHEFRDLLPEALKAALVGVYTWWQYRNNEGEHIPEWLLDVELERCPIWIENEERAQ